MRIVPCLQLALWSVLLAPLPADSGRAAEPATEIIPGLRYYYPRMEPVFMILGQSAGTAASIAIDGELAVQDVDYARLRARLIGDGQVLR